MGGGGTHVKNFFRKCQIRISRMFLPLKGSFSEKISSGWSPYHTCTTGGTVPPPYGVVSRPKFKNMAYFGAERQNTPCFFVKKSLRILALRAKIRHDFFTKFPFFIEIFSIRHDFFYYTTRFFSPKLSIFHQNCPIRHDFFTKSSIYIKIFQYDMFYFELRHDFFTKIVYLSSKFFNTTCFFCFMKIFFY